MFLFAVAAQKLRRADESGFARTFPFLSSRRGWAGRVWRGCGRRSRWFLASPRILDAGGTFEVRRESGFYGTPHHAQRHTSRRTARSEGAALASRSIPMRCRGVRVCRAVAMSGGRNGLESTGLSRVFWRVECPGAAHDWTDLAAPLPRAVWSLWSPTSGASTSVGHGWVSSPSPPSLQISTHTVDSQLTLCPLHLLSAAQ